MAEADSSVESRLDDLEILTAHQAQTIDELSEELRKAYEAIRSMQLKMEHFADRLGAVEDGSGGPPEATKPPHY
ncbi:SlyX protein [Fulvimarina manganoxydans]|uniref:SlyX protein n=1 Tax=Fulvimarina manganoxydans TaxID=937218 RepID=A0A1W1Z970_9HYPH|nr:SlyX family protein [Fulvimarina manganoxydans]MCK5931420.1 SlyX family protein [Fulvimarina manganoxydans]MEE2950408.1 SlyX family protein [Pseudomonadota bacterium]SMC44953.1 SlyX protein [Fulvimarina manganoxydans]